MDHLRRRGDHLQTRFLTPGHHPSVARGGGTDELQVTVFAGHEPLDLTQAHPARVAFGPAVLPRVAADFQTAGAVFARHPHVRAQPAHRWSKTVRCSLPSYLSPPSTISSRPGTRPCGRGTVPTPGPAPWELPPPWGRARAAHRTRSSAGSRTVSGRRLLWSRPPPASPRAPARASPSSPRASPWVPQSG